MMDINASIDAKGISTSRKDSNPRGRLALVFVRGWNLYQATVLCLQNK